MPAAVDWSAADAVWTEGGRQTGIGKGCWTHFLGSRCDTNQATHLKLKFFILNSIYTQIKIGKSGKF